MRFDADEIMSVYHSLYTGILGEAENDSLISSINPSEEGGLVADQPVYNLGLISGKKRQISIKLLNTAGFNNIIEEVSFFSIFPSILQHLKSAEADFKKIPIGKYSAIDLPVFIDFSHLEAGFYSFTISIYSQTGIPICVLVNFSINRNSKDSNYTTNIKENITEFNYSLGKVLNQYSQKKPLSLVKIHITEINTKFEAQDISEDTKWIKTIVLPAKKEFYLMPSGEHSFSKVVGQDFSDQKCYYKNNIKSNVNSFSSRKFYLSGDMLLLQDTPQKLPDFIFRIRKQISQQITVKKMPDWLSVKSLNSLKGRMLTYEFIVNREEMKADSLSGEILFTSGSREIVFPIEVIQHFDSLNVVYIDPEIRPYITKSSDSDSDVGYMACYVKMRIKGKGKAEIIIPNNSILHQGNIENESNEFKEIEYKIQIDRTWLSNQTDRWLFLNLITNTSSGVIKSSICRYYNKKSQIKNSVRGIIGPAKLFYGHITERRFSYEMDEDEFILDYVADVRINDAGSGIINKEILSLESIGKNTFNIICDCKNLAPGSELKAEIQISLKTNQRKFTDRILFFGNVIVSDIAIRIEKNIEQKLSNYDSGKILIKNVGFDSAIIKSILVSADHVLIDPGSQNYFPFYIDPSGSCELKYAVPKENSACENFIYIYYNHPGQPLKISLT